MPLFGHRNQRRHRTSRLAIETSQGFIPRAVVALRDRKVLARLSLVSLAVIVLSIVLEGWTSPFPYRNGDRPDHGILASVDFERINSLETERRRNQAALRVPLHFRSQPLPEESLRAHLRADFQEILDSEQLETLAPEVASAFGLSDAELTAEGSAPVTDPGAAFRALRSLLMAEDIERDAGGQTRAERVEGLLAEFEKLLDVMGGPGIISPSDVKRQQIDAGQQIAISDGERGGKTYGLLDVDMLAMMKPAGRIAVTW